MNYLIFVKRPVRHYSRYIFLFFFLIFVLLVLDPQYLYCQEVTKVRISGKVVDRLTGEPMAYVNVFLSNTTIGTTTMPDGTYSIDHVPMGTYDIVVSMIGYELVKKKVYLNMKKEYVFNFRLKQKDIELPAVTVKGEIPKKWRKDLKKFTRLFLGNTINSSECSILNPEIIDFKLDKEKNEFLAIAEKPIMIENRALGYRIECYLRDFRYKRTGRIVRYKTFLKFTPMKPENEKQEIYWKENRLNTYIGSLRHFLAAWANGCIEDHGFLVKKSASMPSVGRRTVLNEINLYKCISYSSSMAQKEIFFDGYLNVIYTGNIAYKLDTQKKESIWFKGYTSRKGKRSSWLKLNFGFAWVDIRGNLGDPYSICVYGDWASSRIADELPMDYEPPILIGAGSANQEVDYFSVGNDYKNTGKWKEALDIWEKWYEKLKKRGEVDPRIGIKFIELATSKKAKEYYKTANDIYMWGFSKECPEHIDVVIEEAERIIPLLSDTEKKEWRRLIKERDASLSGLIYRFWINQDPRLTTEINERLIEHWERIAFVRENFTRNRDGPYGCDDRGIIYVKYGEPDRKKSGKFGTSSLARREIYRWIGFTMDYTIRNQAMMNVKLLDPKPEYEVWAYDNIGTDRPSIFLFSYKYGSGRFTLVPGIESLYPKKRWIFSSHSTSRTSLSPRDYLIYQIIYYSELSIFDDFFRERYERLEDIWMNDQVRKEQRRETSRVTLYSDNARMLQSISKTHEYQDKFNPISKHADKQKSDFERRYCDTKMVTRTIRTLDEENNPKLTVFVSSSPEFPKKKVRIVDGRLTVPGYRVYHILMIRDDSLNVAKKLTDKKMGRERNFSFFTLDHKNDLKWGTVGAEAVDSDDSLFAIGKRSFNISSPLSGNTQMLEVSDLVIGSQMEKDFYETDLPFNIIPEEVFTRDEPMQVYIEAYNLKPDIQGTHRYDLEYGVVEIKRSGNKVKRKERLTMSYEISSKRSRSSERFGADISKLSPGEYEFFIRVTDKVSGQSKMRKEFFKLVKGSK